jgi:hypothetical protein
MIEMIKHALFFAGAMLLSAVLLRGTENGTMVVTGILVPLWLVTSPMMNKRRQKGQEDCLD